METKLNTNQLGNNEVVFTESTLVGGENILIQKKINPDVLDSDTIGCWHLNGNATNEIADGPVLDSSYITGYTDALIDPWYTEYQCANIQNSSGNPRSLLTTDISSIGTVSDFTFEFRGKCNDTGGFHAYIENSSGNAYLNLSSNTSTGGSVTFRRTGSLLYNQTGLGTSGWHHYAIVRKNKRLAVYLDGIRLYQEEVDDATNIQNFIVFTQISSDGGNRVAEIVLSKVAKWDGASFTVPTEPYTISSTADTYEINATGGGSYVLPAATAQTLGGIKVGSGLSVTQDGTLSASGGSGVAPTTKPFTGRTGSTLETGLTLADYDTIMVFRNGMLLEEATADPVAANDYSISTNSIVFVDALVASDIITLVCLGEVASAPTAGADTSLSNLTDAGKIKSAHLAMPSGVKEELTWGSSNTKYTAPADGYFYATGGTTGSGSTQWVKLCNDSAGFCTAGLGVYGQTNSDVFITCSKGDEIYLYYSGSTNTARGIFFIYANGSESEYTPS